MIIKGLNEIINFLNKDTMDQFIIIKNKLDGMINDAIEESSTKGKVFFTILIEKKDNKIILIKKEEDIDVKIENYDYLFMNDGKRIQFDKKKHILIKFITNFDKEENDYDNENVELIIKKLLEGFPARNLELIYDIKFL